MRGARGIVYGAVAVFAILAMRAISPMTPTEAPVARVTVPPPVWALPYDSVGKGETLTGVLIRAGLNSAAANDVVRAVAPSIDPRRVPVGLHVAVLHVVPDSQPTEVVVQLATDHYLRVTHRDSNWVLRDQRLPWKTDTLVVQGTIHSNLYQAVYDATDSASVPRYAQDALVVKLADDVYQYRVDMTRDLQDGDTFRVMAERQVGVDGTVKIGNVVAAQLNLSGSEIDAVHFTDDKVAGNYFDQQGRALKAAFLRVPLQFKYITSSFGSRFHPILKLWREHKGIDYAANSGTPVRAIGAGVIVRAGVASGYGNLIEIRHANGFSSRYGHLRGFAKGIHAGAHVDLGQTIGYVGMTGLATGPHLHFEFLVHGVQRNPRVALKDVGGDPIPKSLMAEFDSVRNRLIGELVAKTGGAVTTVAQR